MEDQRSIHVGPKRILFRGSIVEVSDTSVEEAVDDDPPEQAHGGIKKEIPTRERKPTKSLS